MKIILLCGGQPNQIALANKVSQEFNLVGIVIEKKPGKKLPEFKVKQLFIKVLDRIVFKKIHQTWKNLMNYYATDYSAFPKTETITVSNINSEETISFINKLQPDLIMVSGTGLIKNKILSLPIKNGIVNLHTGLSPFIKGGPNCTNWCMATRQYQYIGNTIMWIDAGIDSGALIATEQTPLNGNESFEEIHIKVMDHAHELYLRSLRQIEKDKSNVPSVLQSSITTGTTYFTKDWNLKARWKLFQSISSDDFRKNYNSAEFIRLKKEVKTVSLP